MVLSVKEREKMLGTIRRTVASKHINVNNPEQDYRAWLSLVDARSDELLRAESASDFEAGVQQLLGALGSSHTAFFRTGDSVPCVHALNATVRAIEEPAGALRWMFLDVIEDGAAHRAGVKPGELLTGIDGNPLAPPHQPAFRLGASYALDIVGCDGRRRSAVITVPNKAAKDRPPMIEPRSLTCRMLPEGIGFVKVASFPGTIGRDFALALDAAIADLKQSACDRLIVDLRGNVGGGLGSLRLMSYLCSGRLPIGHSLTRARLRKGYDKEKLVRINRIPARKRDLLMMALRFKLIQRDRSMVLETEGLGPQPFHGRIVILINEFTHSAAEMVASFASENRLATLVGEKSAGQVLGGANFKLVRGYQLRMPVAGWYTWRGDCIEGRGVEPDVPVPLTREGLCAGRDEQSLAALECARMS